MSGYIGTTPVPQASQTRDVFTATAGQTTFATTGYTPSFLDVYVNGSHLKNGTDYTASNGSDVVMASGLAVGDYVEVVAFTTFSTSDTVSASSGGTFTGAVTVQGAFTSKGIDDNASSTAMTIDSSGNILVDKTSASVVNDGIQLEASGTIGATRDGDDVLILNRKSSDGNIAVFRKDNSTVGSISCSNSGSYIYFGSSAESVGLGYGGGFVFPTTGSTTGSDNSKDFGSPSYRWDDIYATNGSIQTSDINEKQDIAALTDAEQRVAVAAKGLLRKFRWKSAVAEKGEAARTHFGIIAQDLQAAFEAEGLDAGKYAMFISSTWWEHEVEVPAVEADEENGIEAADAYTRIDTYDTQEEAPQGATQKTRLGVRYSELLAFIIGAL